MKTKKELMKIAMTKGDWKHCKLWFWADTYEEKMNEWNNMLPPVSDDRRLFINTYNQVYTAIDSLQDNPPAWVCVAINNAIDEECKTMDKILSVFKDENEELCKAGDED